MVRQLGRTFPNFETGPERSRRRAQFYMAGPQRRTGDGELDSADPAKNPTNHLMTAVYSMPNTTAIRLERIPRDSDLWAGPETEFQVKVHYRILKPIHLAVLLNDSRTLVVDPSAASHADPIAGTGINFTGDTTVTICAEAHPNIVFTNLVHSIANASGLGVALSLGSERSRWAWACFAECAVISERIDSNYSTWRWIGPSMEGGCWWFNVYLVEVESRNGGWISNGV